jgi:hypothetical protein
MAYSVFSRLPGDPREQLRRVGFETAAEVHDRVHARQAQATLELADLRAMHRRTDAELILREPREPTRANQVVAEPPCDVHQPRSRRSKCRAARLGSISSLSDRRRPTAVSSRTARAMASLLGEVLGIEGKRQFVRGHAGRVLVEQERQHGTFRS